MAANSKSVAMALSDEQLRRLGEQAGKIDPKKEEEVREKFEASEEKAKKAKASPSLLDGLRTLYDMLADPDYVISWETKKWILLGLGYFISPIDIIPDVLPGIGYVDDALVVAWVLHKIAKEVAAYRKAKGVPASVPAEP